METILSTKNMKDQFKNALIPSDSEEEGHEASANPWPIQGQLGGVTIFPEPEHDDGTQDGLVDTFCCKLKPVTVNIILSTVQCVSMIVMGLSVPVYIEAAYSAGSNAFIVMLVPNLWFPLIFLILNFIVVGIGKEVSLYPTVSWKAILLVGSLDCLSGTLATYSSDPSRVPLNLQAVLPGSIPLNVAFRYLILRKGVSRGRLVCIIIIMLGLLIASEPTIFDMEGGNSAGDEDHSLGYRIIWPIVFILSAVPSALYNVYVEKNMKQDEVESFSFLHYVQWVDLLGLICIFWVDIIPGFGTASSLSQFGEYQWRGLKCHFSSDESCHGLMWISWVFTCSYSIVNLSFFLMMRYTEGVIYTAILGALVTPITALFWTLFRLDPHLQWSPSFSVATTYTIVGLMIMVPTAIIYNVISVREEEYRHNMTEQLPQDTTITDTEHSPNDSYI